jgi:hypothetical protein
LKQIPATKNAASGNIFHTLCVESVADCNIFRTLGKESGKQHHLSLSACEADQAARYRNLSIGYIFPINDQFYHSLSIKKWK